MRTRLPVCKQRAETHERSLERSLGGGDEGATPAHGHLPPEPLPRPWVCLPAPPTPLGPAGRWGSLPVPAAQLPAVLILAALRVIHLVDTETLLEVLGPDLGIQDLLSRVAGEPASLLIVQPLAEDPSCAGRRWGGSAALARPPSVRAGSTGEAFGPFRKPLLGTADWVCPRMLGRYHPDALLGSSVCAHGCDGNSKALCPKCMDCGTYS